MTEQTSHNYLFRPAHTTKGIYPRFFRTDIHIVGLSPIAIAHAVRNCTFTPTNDYGTWVKIELVMAENMMELYNALKRIDAPTPISGWCIHTHVLTPDGVRVDNIRFEYTEDSKPKWTDTWSALSEPLDGDEVITVRDDKGVAHCILERVN